MREMWVAVLAAALHMTLVGAQQDLFELNIIHFNDFHAHFEEVTLQGTSCDPEAQDCIGGLARLVTGIKEVLELEPDSLVLNGGDTFQGTPWYNFMRWNVSAHFMNMIPHDAHVLGNHEFDHDIEGLVPYLERLEAPMLCANMDTSDEPRLQGLYQHHTILTRNGRRIGIIGVLLTSFSAPIGGARFTDEAAAVRREAAILTEEGVDIIIVLSHCGFDCDKRMASIVGPEVDIIVGGHSHTLLYTGEAPNGDFAADEYPTLVTQDSGHVIPIVQASAYTRYLGNIKLWVDDAGVVRRWEGQPIFLGTSIVPDEQMVGLLEPWRQEVDAVAKEVLGRSKVVLNRSWCWSGECNLGSFACDAFLEELMPLAEGENWHSVHACLINAGGLRQQILIGEVTTQDLLMAMPFENMVQTYDLRGDYLLEALEFAVGVYYEPGAFNSGRMLQIGGMRIVVNASMPVNSRIMSAQVRCIACAVPRYEPLDPSAVYRLVTQDYIGDGGGGYTMLSDNRQNLQYIGLDYVLLQNYLRRLGTIFAETDDRINVVY